MTTRKEAEMACYDSRQENSWSVGRLLNFEMQMLVILDNIIFHVAKKSCISTNLGNCIRDWRIHSSCLLSVEHCSFNWNYRLYRRCIIHSEKDGWCIKSTHDNCYFLSSSPAKNEKVSISVLFQFRAAKKCI